MNSTIVYWLHEASKHFASVMGLAYIVAKLIIRDITHRAIGHKYDVLGVFAWFGVDIAVLSISVGAATKIHEKMKFLSYEEIVIWYFSCTVCLFFSILLYAWFTKRRDSLKQRKMPEKDLGLATLLSVIWVIGFGLFMVTFNALK
jgi:hypothetical protein